VGLTKHGTTKARSRFSLSPFVLVFPRLGLTQVDFSSFSFGMLMWTVWCWRLPYSDQSTEPDVEAVLGGLVPDTPGDVPPEFRSIMVSCWTKQNNLPFSDISKALQKLCDNMFGRESLVDTLTPSGGAPRVNSAAERSGARSEYDVSSDDIKILRTIGHGGMKIQLAKSICSCPRPSS
jgi:hypothetical protein